MKKNMKHSSLFILLLSISFIVGAQPEWPPVGKIGQDYNQLDADGKKQGLWYRTYSDGGLYYSGYFKNDKPQPNSKLYYYQDNGKLMAIHSFRENNQIVDARHFFKNGKIQSTGKYLNQKKDSIWNFYDEKGILRSMDSYKLDSLDGNSIIYYPSGGVLKNQSYSNGTPIGKWFELYEDGKTRTSGNWKNGKYDGDFVFYHSNGNKEASGKYLAGIKDGQWLYYTSNGKLEMQVLYEKGEQIKAVRHNGDHIEYYPSGIPRIECSYKDGELDGLYTEYYDEGEWIREQQPINEPGMQIEFIEKLINRQASKECEYVNGKLKGEVLYFDLNGTLLKKEYFENGELKETILEE